MNHLSHTDVCSAVRAVIDRHDLPPFVRGYDVRVDEWDGTPGFWVTFKVTPIAEVSRDGILRRGRELLDMERLLDADFQHEVDGYMSFYRFQEVSPVVAAG